MLQGIKKLLGGVSSSAPPQRYAAKTIDLCLEIEKEYGNEFIEKLLKYPYLTYLLDTEKRFQNRVLFPHFSITTPITLKLSDFKGQFFPAFLKGKMDTTYVENQEQLNEFDELHRYKVWYCDRHCVIQQYIKPETGIASHLRVVLSLKAHDDSGSIRGAVVLYNKNPEEHRSNHRFGGIPIALTGDGALEDITDDFEIKMLKALNIYHDRRWIPADVLNSIFKHRDSEGRRLYDHLFYNSWYTGIDLVYGRPFSNGSFLTQTPQWHFLEVQQGPDNSFLHEIKAWIPERRYSEQILRSA